MKVQVAAIIAAAGSSRRMGGIKKEFRMMPAGSTDVSANGGMPLTVLGRAAGAFDASACIDIIAIAIPAGAENEALKALPATMAERTIAGTDIKKILLVTGGPDRQSSVFNALKAIECYNPLWVLIHDGARPWIKPGLIEKITDAVMRHEAVIPVLPLVETPKECVFSGSDGSGYITRHLRRGNTGGAQTPQAFAFAKILEAHKKAASCAKTYTDDAEIWGEFMGRVYVISGDPENRKITFPQDLEEFTVKQG